MIASEPLERTIAVLVLARNALVAVRMGERYLQLFALPTNTQLDAPSVLLIGFHASSQSSGTQ